MELEKKTRAPHGTGQMSTLKKMVANLEAQLKLSEERAKAIEACKEEGDIKITLSETQKAILVIAAKKNNKTLSILCTEAIQEKANELLEGLRL